MEQPQPDYRAEERREAAAVPPEPSRRGWPARLLTALVHLLHGVVAGLGVGWLALCITLPALVLPARTSSAVVPLPVAPVLTQVQTSWRTPQIIGYSGYTLTTDEDLAAVAQQGGSDPTLLLSYNLLAERPTVDFPLIVPHLAGYTQTLTSEPLLVLRGRTDRPYVALTLDAGAGSAPVPGILETLRERNTRITFFLTGAWIEQNPELARQVAADGHELANHSLSHADFRDLSDEEIIAELDITERRAITTTGMSTRPYFRPPYGAYDERVLDTVIGQGYLPIYWTLDSLDSVGEPKSPEFLFERITATLSQEDLHGAIILAHCGSQATADALPAILDRFAEMGLEVRPVSEVLGP